MKIAVLKIGGNQTRLRGQMASIGVKAIAARTSVASLTDQPSSVPAERRCRPLHPPMSTHADCLPSLPSFERTKAGDVFPVQAAG